MAFSYKFAAYAAVFLSFLALATGAFAQAKASSPQTIFRDSDGNVISNNEFVDIRMANFHYPDATIVTKLDDVTQEFRLQKVPQEGMKAPAMIARTIDGKAIDTSSLHGKVIVLNFWFIGCASCRAHQPKLNELKQKFSDRDDVIFLAVTPDPSADVRRYLSKEKFEYLQVADAEPLLKTFRFKGYPKNIVINRQGEMVYWRSTVHAWEKFESVIRTELVK